MGFTENASPIDQLGWKKCNSFKRRKKKRTVYARFTALIYGNYEDFGRTWSMVTPPEVTISFRVKW
jgi:hypothetical protein